MLFLSEGGSAQGKRQRAKAAAALSKDEDDGADLALLAAQEAEQLDDLKGKRVHAWVLVLAAALSVVDAASPVHYDSTRMYSHTNDNGQDQASRDVGDPGTRGFKDPAQYLNNHLGAETQRAGVGSFLLQSIATAGLDGWSAVSMVNTPTSVDGALMSDRGQAHRPGTAQLAQRRRPERGAPPPGRGLASTQSPRRSSARRLPIPSTPRPASSARTGPSGVAPQRA